jgi:hypothetical protein
VIDGSEFTKKRWKFFFKVQMLNPLCDRFDELRSLLFKMRRKDTEGNLGGLHDDVQRFHLIASGVLREIEALSASNPSISFDALFSNLSDLISEADHYVRLGFYLSTPELASNVPENITDEILRDFTQAEMQTTFIDERRIELSNLQRDVRQLRQLFETVALHATDQAETIEHIESNVSSAQVSTSRAYQELDVTSSRSGRPNLCLYFVIVFLLLIMIYAVSR